MILVISITIIVAIVISRKKNRKNLVPKEIELENSTMTEIAANSSKYLIKLEELDFTEKLAQGAYGVVFKGKWRKQLVAIKEIHFRESEGAERERFERIVQELRNEISTLSLLRHRNIVTFMGFCIKPPDTYAIVTEFIEGGSLYDRLHVPKKKANFKWNQKKKIQFQIACACLFLHQQGVVHRDLKSHNILLDGYPGDQIVPKVCDFGLAKSRETMELANATNTQSVGTPLWMAPEVVSGSAYGSECDVYSFAIIMYEILFEKLPYSEQKLLTSIQFKVASDPNFRPALPPDQELESQDIAEEERESKKRFIELMKQCWQHNPQERPKFEEIVDRLEKI